MKKYAVFGGYVNSINDGQEHYIPSHKVAELYKVPISQCILIPDDWKSGHLYDLNKPFEELMDIINTKCRKNPLDKLLGTKNLIHLYPDESGEYKLP